MLPLACSCNTGMYRYYHLSACKQTHTCVVLTQLAIYVRLYVMEYQAW